MAYLTKRKAPKQRQHDWRVNAHQRGYTKRWAAVRAIVMRAEPMCRHCKTTPAAEVDHIIPIKIGGTNAMDNLQPLCKACHARKTDRDKRLYHM